MLQIINPNPTIPPAQNITTPIPPANPFRQKPTMFFEGMDRSQRIEADFQSEGHISLKKQPTIYFEKTTRKKEFDNSANTDYMMGSNIAFVTLDERNMYLDQSTCSICNQAFSSDLVTRALQCDHAFHEDCLRESFKTLDEVRCHNCGRPA